MPKKDINREEVIPMSNREDSIIQQVAALWGVSPDEAASRLASQELARRFKRKTGETPAKIYQLEPRKRKDGDV